MNPEKRNHLRVACALHLRVNDIKPTSVKGKAAIHTYWMGVLDALQENPPDPVVTLCMLSGRYEDLCGLNEGEFA